MLRMRTGLRVVVPLNFADERPRGVKRVFAANVRVDQVAVRPVAHVGQVLEVVREGELVDPGPAGRPGSVVRITERATVVILDVLVLFLDVGEARFLVEGPFAG